MGDEDSSHYDVIAKDATSVVIRIENKVFEEEGIRLITFDGPRYWICLGNIHEWFKKTDG